MTLSSVNVSTMPQQMQQALFSSLDKNADGVLSQSEFQSIGQNVPASANTAASSASTSTATVQATSLATSSQSFSSEILQALLSLQTNGSSSCSSQDPLLAQNSSDLASFDPASAATNLEQTYGSNGSMTQSQFESALQNLNSESSQGSGQVGHHHHHHPPEDAASTAQAADKTFQAADANGDGQLSTTELSSYLSMRQQTAQQGVAQYQAASDLLSGFLSNLLAAVSGTSTTAATTTASQTVTV